jgi:acetyl/propionyl-CoA carboxylase alpha subunit/acetyl-CoA carboxylase carboxyltransferase component
MFSRVAIVNRGEPAMRFIHAVGELNAAGGPRIETVALYTDTDATATFVRAADLAYRIGPAAARPYLDLAVLERALVETGADAAWVGWGFVAESPEFAELCEKLGVTFIGPDPLAMRKLGDKIGAKLIAERAGIPVGPWSRGPVENLEAALRSAQDIGYPLMLKATAGGGGRGIRVIAGPEGLIDAYERTSLEAERAFGSGVMFLERLVTGARHVEVQVIADGHGTAWALGVRDCSLQRRNQKIIEESSSPVLSPKQAGALKAAAERLAISVGYRGAATVEFLYSPASQEFAFLEVNTRLQVEHPVTEVTTGIDLVKAQLLVAAGGRLTGSLPAELGHAIEARLNAEDPDRDFAPAPGRIVLLDLPAGPGIRVDAGVSTGDCIPADFDSMIAKIIAYGRDRNEALARLRHAMRQTHVLIEGGTTNKSFVVALLDQPEVIDGSADTGWIDRMGATGLLGSNQHSSVALAVAAIEAYQDRKQVELQRLLATTHGGRPQMQHASGRPIDLTLRGASYRLTVAESGPGRYRVGFVTGNDVRAVGVRLERFGEHAGQVHVNGRRFRLVTGTHGPVCLVEIDGVTHRVSRDEGGIVHSPAPAMVVATPLAVGDTVEAGVPVLVLESMKMETVLRAPYPALLKESLVCVGSQVEAGAPLLRLEPLGGNADDLDGVAPVAPAADLDLLAEPAPLSAGQRAERRLADLRDRLLGFDVDPRDGSRTLTDYLAVRAELERRPLAAESELLEIFADLSELSRDKPEGEEAKAGTWLHSPREHFRTYLQSLDAERVGLSEAFQGRLTRVLRHYGIHGLDRTPELEEAVFRIFLAQQRASSDVAVIAALLERWLSEASPDDGVRQTVARALENLVRATQFRFPMVAVLARSLVFRWFAQPLLHHARAEAHTRVRRHLRYLDQHPDAADRAARIADIVDSPEPLVRLLGQGIDHPGADVGPLLEAISRRYYREHGLSGVRCESIGERPIITGRYEFDGKPQRLVATVAGFGDLSKAMMTVAEAAAADPDSTALVADVFLTGAGHRADADGMAAELCAAFSAVELPGELRRITAVAAGRRGVSMRHFTFQMTPAGLAEDRLLRDLHPPTAQWLQLWRLRNFKLTRLPTTDEDIYLLRCVAPENPADERLVALAQVHDATPLRDEEGRILALPAIEATLGACLDAIRQAQEQRPKRRRQDTNRIVLYAWPASDEVTREDINAVIQRLVPTIAGPGVEEILFLGRHRYRGTGGLRAVRLSYDVATGVQLSVTDPPTDLIQPLDDYGQKVLRARRRGAAYPYELIDMIAGPGGSFTEYDVDDSGTLVPVDRPKGLNEAGIVIGVAATPTERYPEGMTRVVLLGDPTRDLGALAQPECARVIAALDLAGRLQVPVDWYALSAGARIAMDSGTENLDWTAAVLRRIVHFTEAGGEINVVVAGVNVGAQSYWNAESTMLMHTRGILVMTPDSAMVLTGKRSLDFSGGVSAEDNVGIGGYDRVMGPNGQAQYWAPDLRAAHRVLLSHYEYCYVLTGEDGPRRAVTSDPADRDVTDYPHVVTGSDFTTVGQIFFPATNPDRKKPFDIRTVMRALSDQDHPVLERWSGMAGAETAVVQDANLGGWPVCLVGIESRPVPRHGFPPTDGPDAYTAGTLFPRSSKKVARAINAVSGNRPLVVLANLSGFDGSPESMRKLQLEYGADIGRAVVNFRGPIVFCVISRYHGGAFVVFSKALNPNITVLAVDGAFASVLGGTPAAAVVFAADVDASTAADRRVAALEAQISSAEAAERAALVARLADVRASVRAEKLAETAAEFDREHSIQRAQRVGSVDSIIRPTELRPQIIAAVERGLDRSRDVTKLVPISS